MTLRDVLLPLFVEVILTFVLLFWMAFLRTSAVTSGSIATRDIALREPNWPAGATQVANAFHNQLELPMLFYVLTILVIIVYVNYRGWLQHHHYEGYARVLRDLCIWGTIAITVFNAETRAPSG